MLNRKHVTDLQILDTIHKKYFSTYKAILNRKIKSPNKIYLPIDCAEIGKQLGVDGQIIFGRLYYHLDQIHRYQQEEGAMVHLFAFKVGDEYHCINYPYLDGVLAGYKEEKNRYEKSFWISISALLISFLALLSKAIKF